MVVIDASHKIVVTGLGRTGKTVLLERYMEDHFVGRYVLTVVANFYMKIVEHAGKKLFLKFWEIFPPNTYLLYSYTNQAHQPLNSLSNKIKLTSKNGIKIPKKVSRKKC